MSFSPKTSLSIALGSAFALLAPAAFAQDTAPATGTAEASADGHKVTTTTRVETAGAAHTTRTTVEDDATSDHEKVVGHFGVGYLGVSDLPISGAPGAAGAGPARQSLNAPVIGVRYWLAEKLGLDLGLGFGLRSGSTETVTGPTSQTVDQGSAFGLAFHGGVPLVFAHQKHFKFLVIPEMNIGFTNLSTETPNGATKTTQSGFRLDLGGRIGGEIHFGFIGVPQLALQATVGAFIKREAWKISSETAGVTNSASAGVTQFGTSVQADPWAIFTNNISAIYYLP